eukprot:11417710-Alexandrium_andersonii.AAC.1
MCIRDSASPSASERAAWLGVSIGVRSCTSAPALRRCRPAGRSQHLLRARSGPQRLRVGTHAPAHCVARGVRRHALARALEQTPGRALRVPATPPGQAQRRSTAACWGSVPSAQERARAGARARGV